MIPYVKIFGNCFRPDFAKNLSKRHTFTQKRINLGDGKEILSKFDLLDEIMTGKRLKIAVADSGMGGLSLVAEMVRRKWDAEIVYLAHPEKMPYGDLSEGELVKEGAYFYNRAQKHNACMLVLACNTLTAAAADELRRYAKIPLVGVEPAVTPAVQQVAAGKILVLTTPATAREPRFLRLVALQTRGNLLVHACPTLAKTVEEHFFSPEIIDRAVREEPGLFRGRVSGIVAGCTHYALIRPALLRFFGDIPFFDGKIGTVNRVQTLGGLALGEGETRVTYDCGSRADAYKRVLENLLERNEA